MYEGEIMIQEALELADEIDEFLPNNNISDMIRRLVDRIQELEK